MAEKPTYLDLLDVKFFYVRPYTSLSLFLNDGVAVSLGGGKI